MLKTSLVILFSAVLLGTVVAICPPEMLTRPCTCSTQNRENILRCENITEKTVLSGVFRRTGVARFSYLQLINVSIESIPPSSLHTKQFKSIEIENSNLTTLFGRAPPPLNLLRALNLRNVNFEDPFPWKEFKTLRSLVAFAAIGVKIPVLDRNFKDNVNKGLTLFGLLNTSTVEIKDGVFSDFRVLEEVRIENNSLSEYKRSYFSRTSNIISLYLDGNQIQTLPADAFARMPRLQSLNLSNNKLSTIPEGVFSQIQHRVSYLNLDDNPLNCDCGFNWLLSNPPKYSFTGRCESPEKVKGKSIKDLKSSDLEGSCH